MLVEGYRTDLTGLTDAEVRTLFAARAVGHLADLGLDAAGDAALLKLVAALPAVYRPVAERALERIHLDADVWFNAAEDVPYLSVDQEAVWLKSTLLLEFRRDNG